MLLVTDHPLIANERFTTAMISWWDGGLHFFEKAPVGIESTTILGTYYFSYFLVFLCGWFMLHHWVKKGSLEVKKSEVLDIGIYTLLGVMLGAKLVYVLFYNFEYYLDNPSAILLNWSGMASHGAVVGVSLAIYLFAKRFKRDALQVFDHCTFVALLGPIFIRGANFLNGELYGKSTDADSSVAMRFPMRDGQGRELFAKVERDGAKWKPAEESDGEVGSALYSLVRSENGEMLAPEDQHIIESQAHHQYELLDDSSHLGPVVGFRLKDESGEVSKQFTAVRMVVTDPSHPSQLYQLGVSGILLMLILLIVRWRAKFVGTVFGSFLVLYGISRIAMEVFRQPDPQRSTGFFQFLSMGQLLSIGVILAGVAVLYLAKKRARPVAGRTNPEPQAIVPEAVEGDA